MLKTGAIAAVFSAKVYECHDETGMYFSHNFRRGKFELEIVHGVDGKITTS